MFEDLNRSRGWLNGAPLPLSWSEIEAYLRLREMPPGEDREELLEQVLYLDRVYLELMLKKQKG